jgi:transcriptional regulator with XRE-family HTH domain
MRLRNNIFAAAFDYLKRNKGIKTQKQLAQLMGVSEDTITRILKDRTEVTEDVITKLQTASGCIFNLQWLRGEDATHMLAQDLADDVGEVTPQQGMPDPSSMVNALLAKSDETISALKSVIETKDEQIADLRRELEDKRDHIETLKHRCAELRRIIDAHNFNIDTLPFPPGVADKTSQKPIKK